MTTAEKSDHPSSTPAPTELQHGQSAMDWRAKVVETAAQKKARLEAQYEGGKLHRPRFKDTAD